MQSSREFVAALFLGILVPAIGMSWSCVAGSAGFVQEPPLVTAVKASRGVPERTLRLPGTVHPFEEAVIFPRVSGYLKRWLVDIGDQVKAGQVIAEVDTPELDQQLAEAQQRLAQAEANLQLARVTAERYRSLRAQDAVSAQEVDEHSSDLEAKTAMFRGVKAEIERLRDFAAFKHVRAPFAGVVGARNLEKTARGALLDAGSRDAAAWLYKINLIDPLRVYVAVPQTYMTLIRKGTDSEIEIREFPGRVYKGTVSRTSQTLDAASRTLLTEVQIPNPKGQLYPGLYANVKFVLTDEIAPVVVPGSAVLSSSGAARVAVVDERGHVSMRKVVLGRDLGKVVEIIEGVKEGERVISNPGDTLADGAPVRLVNEGGRPPAPAVPSSVNKAKQQQ